MSHTFMERFEKNANRPVWGYLILSSINMESYGYKWSHGIDIRRLTHTEAFILAYDL